MRGFRNHRTNMCFQHPATGIGDLWADARPNGFLVTYWRPSPAELEELAAGGVVTVSLARVVPLAVGVAGGDEAQELDSDVPRLGGQRLVIRVEDDNKEKQ